MTNAVRQEPFQGRHSQGWNTAGYQFELRANVKAVQTMLGHASAVLTLDTYSDLFPDDLDAVAARLDEAVRKQSVGRLWVVDGNGPTPKPGRSR